MRSNDKNWFSNVVYYTLAILTILCAGFFVYCLVMNPVAMWAKIIFFVWTGLVIGTVIFDMICTNTGESKQVSGMIVYVLSLLALAMSCVLYFINTGMGALTTEFLNLFISVSFVALLTTGFMIATWVTGQSKVENKTDDRIVREKEKAGN